MAGWNKKSGNYTGKDNSDDELWSLFAFVFSDSCMKTNTYKFALIKSICDQVYDLKENDGMYFLPYDVLFSRFTENYWNLISKYNLRQMSSNGKSEYSKIELIIKEFKDKHSEVPQELPFLSLQETDRKEIIRQVYKHCRQCVLGALYDDFQGKLYSFDRKGKGIYLGKEAYFFICKYKVIIEKLNYYAWARFLEKKNKGKALENLLEKLDEAIPEREDLSKYRDILYNELKAHNCFYCDKEFKRTIHVDHFIPWSFVKSDNLWNFVLACPKCNINKKNYLPDPSYVCKIEKRNSEVNLKKSQFIKEEFSNYYPGLIEEMWSYARMSGIKVRTIKK